MLNDIIPPRGPEKPVQPLKDTVDPPEPPASYFMPPQTSSKPVVKNMRSNHFMEKLRKIFHKPRNKKEWAIFAAITLLLIGGLSGGAYAYYRSQQKPPVQQAAEPAPEPPPPPPPTTEPSRLTGVEIAIELNKRPVTGVMIENSPDARPQSGLREAGIVFEAVAEGGITRFLALFQEAQPDLIGPVRSARPYYIDWLLGYDASYAHVGGSPEGLAHIRAQGVKDLDQFSNSGAYWRASDRYAPHNMYTSTAKLDELNQAKGYTTSTFVGFERKQPTPNPAPPGRVIDFDISSFNYNVRYEYDPAANHYLRFMGGKPHLDKVSAAQMSPTVVVAMIMNKGSNGKYSTYGTVGSGKVIVYQNGEVTPGTWSKAGLKDPIVLADATGAPLKLSPGQTWITALGAESDVVHAP